MCASILPATFDWNISHSRKNLARHYRKCTQVFTYSTRYSCQEYNETGIFSTVFSNSFQIPQFMQICLVQSEMFPANGRMERHDETNSRLSRLWERT